VCKSFATNLHWDIKQCREHLLVAFVVYSFSLALSRLSVINASVRDAFVLLSCSSNSGSGISSDKDAQRTQKDQEVGQNKEHEMNKVPPKLQVSVTSKCRPNHAKPSS